MTYRIAAIAAVLALGAVPAFAQNSSNLSPFNIPLSNGGMKNLDAPGANGSDSTSVGANAGAPMRGAVFQSGRVVARTAEMQASNASSMDYPVCRTRAQDRCRVSSIRR